MPVKIKGATSGDITLTTPAVAGTNTLTLPATTGNIITSADSATVTQSMMASGVAGTGPAFSAYSTSSQTVNVNTFTKIQLSSELFDTANAFDSTTNYRFQPTVAGYYQLSGAIGSAALGTILVSIFKNASEAVRGFQGGIGAATSTCVNVSSLIYLNGSTDYVELYYYQTGSSPSASTAGGGSVTYFNGALVRAG